MFTSSSVSASPMHSNWNSCRDCENFCTATERSAGQREAESEEGTAELAAQLASSRRGTTPAVT